MATTQEGYGMRYQKIKTNKLRSVSPSHYAHGNQSPRHMNQHSQQTQLGKVIAQLSDRVDGIEIKIVNLFQKYTETKDNQYEKEKQSEEFRKNIGERVGHIESLQIQAKINEFQSLMQKAKAQITAMEGLRMSIQRQNSKKTFGSPQPFDTIPKTIQSPTTNTKQIMSEIQDIMDQMELNLREEMNKKIDICMTFFKNATQSSNPSKANSPSSVNAIMMQEQIHNMTLTMNKVESDCNRNKMIIENKITQIIDYVNSIKKKTMQGNERQTSRQSKSPIKNSRRNEQEQNYSEHSSISKRSKKSKSKEKSKKNVDSNLNEGRSSRAEEQKKQKETQLKEALRRKKENQEKLKMKK